MKNRQELSLCFKANVLIFKWTFKNLFSFNVVCAQKNNIERSNVELTYVKVVKT